MALSQGVCGGCFNERVQLDVPNVWGRPITEAAHPWSEVNHMMRTDVREPRSRTETTTQPREAKVLMREFIEGDHAEFSKTITEADITLFVAVSGDTNPVHIDEEYARTTPFGQRIAHGLLTAGLISTVLGTKLPGPGAIYVSQSLRFLAPVAIGDTVTASVTLTEYDRDRGEMTLETGCFNQSNLQVLAGEAVVLCRPN